MNKIYSWAIAGRFSKK